MQAKVLIGRFPFGNQEVPDIADWLVKTVVAMKADPRISDIYHMRRDDTPITMSRNHVLKECLNNGVDYCLMVDSDMNPDLPIYNSKPFWPGAFDFALQHNGPCVIGVPYCGPPPVENVYIFRWARQQEDHPNCDMRMEQYTREEAARRGGFEEVAALPTGIVLISMEGVKRLKPPWFDYEWTDEYQTHKASTEDVYFTRNLSLAGVKQYVMWDAWAGHWKRKCVGRPTLLSVDAVIDRYKESILRNDRSNERLIDIGCGINHALERERNGHAVVPANPARIP